MDTINIKIIDLAGFIKVFDLFDTGAGTSSSISTLLFDGRFQDAWNVLKARMIAVFDDGLMRREFISTVLQVGVAKIIKANVPFQTSFSLGNFRIGL